MNCYLCNGALKFENGIYTCTNCGTKQQIPSHFENTEVFICYIENDGQGRRTKDSVIAQDIYNKLQSAKINTFYQRISAADLFADDLKKARISAIDQAKVIIVCAASKENFITLLDENREKFAAKKIIPVYTSINANNIPEELGKLQAVSYDNIGALTDLLKNILNFLDKQTEADVFNIVKEQILKKQKRLIITICSVLIALIFALLYIIFGTPYILKSRKYNYAEKLVDSGNYTEAINLFSTIGQYKNAKNILNDIYNAYDGYYNNDMYSLGLNIDSNSTAKIEFAFTTREGESIKFNSQAQVEGNEISFYFKDNQQNEGKGQVILNDQGIHFKLSGDDKRNDTYDVACFFEINEKSDASRPDAMSQEIISEWVRLGLTVDDLKVRGYEVTQLKRIGHIESNFLWQINNADIKFSTWGDAIAILVVPAKYVLPDRIGASERFILKDDVLYVPNGEIVENNLNANLNETQIEENTEIMIISKNMYEYAADEYRGDWNEFLNYFMEKK